MIYKHNNRMYSKPGIKWLGLFGWMKDNKASLAFKTMLLLVVITLCGLVITGCGVRGTIPRGWSGGTVADGMLVVGSMEGKLVAVNMTAGNRLWDIVLETQEQASTFFGCSTGTPTVAMYGSPVVRGKMIYVTSYNGRVYAIDAETRLSTYINLRKDEKSAVWPIVGGPVINSGRVYIGSSDGYVYALDSVGLAPIWDEPFKTGDKIWSTPAVDGDSLYIGSFDKKCYAINTATGKAKWDEPFETEGAIVATPVLYDNTVYIGSFDKNLYAVGADNGDPKWKFTANNWFWAKPVIYNNTVYAGCLDGSVYILDAQSGDKLNEIELGSPVSSSPVLVGDLVIMAAEDGTVYAIDTSNYQVKWTNIDIKETKQKIYASLCSAEDKVYIHTNKGELYVLSAVSGAKIWSISLKSS